MAGWKQREHPYLHNTFHIGDRLVTVCGAPVTTAAEANTIIRNDPGTMVSVVMVMKVVVTVMGGACGGGEEGGMVRGVW